MLRSITDPSMDREMSETVRTVQDQLDRLTPFEISNDAFRRIVNGAAESFRSWTDEQRQAANDYMASLDPRDQVSMAMREQRKSTQQIAEALNVSVEWVRRTNARHLHELRMRLYP